MPSANQKRMIKHIHETVFILLHDYHFDEITVQKYVICRNQPQYVLQILPR